MCIQEYDNLSYDIVWYPTTVVRYHNTISYYDMIESYDRIKRYPTIESYDDIVRLS